MPLNLYRRHRPDCEGGHAEDSLSGEFEERKKTWRKCICTIFISGTLRRKFKRKQTGKSDWEQARAIADTWEAAKSWDSTPDLPQPVLEAEAKKQRMEI